MLYGLAKSHGWVALWWVTGRGLWCEVLVVGDLVSCLLCSQKGNGTFRQRNFPSLEACLDYLGIVFSSQSIRKPLEPQGLLLLESLVTVVQRRDVGAAEYTWRNWINLLGNGDFCHFDWVMLAVLQMVVVVGCGTASAVAMLVSACMYESLFVHRWAWLDAELTSHFHHLNIQRPYGKWWCGFAV